MTSPLVATNRLQKDYNELLNNPIDNAVAHPTDDNILLWHFVLLGPSDCPFEGGVYHGELVFSADYPIKPPAIYFITPNGLFKTNTDLCFHYEDDKSQYWTPGNTISSILIGLVEMFAKSDTIGPFTSIDKVSIELQKSLAKMSRNFNLNDKTFCKYFPQIHKLIDEESNGNDIAMPEQ